MASTQPNTPSGQREATASVTSGQKTPSFGFVAFTVLFTGTGILMLEVLGTRIAGPIFGVSLYIWTALISVTLTSLAVGYWIGGPISDRYPRADLMYGLILLAGLFIAFLPAIDGPVLNACYQAFRIRMGVLAASFVLFAPPLTLLGMVSPFAIKLALADLRKTGKTAGKLYAISTVGSVAGSILTGYVLIPGIGVSKTLFVITAMVLTPPVVWFVIARRLTAVGAGVVGLAVALLVGAEPAQASLGPSMTMIDKRDSLYGQIKVVDQVISDPDHPDPRLREYTVRQLLIEGTTQTAMLVEQNVSATNYVHIMTYFLQFHPPAERQMLLIGLGGGVQVHSFNKLGYEVDAVEIDPTVSEFAVKYFGLDQDHCRVIEEDGRAYLRTTDQRYDVVVFDVAGGGSQPFHLFSKEAFEEAESVLAPGGIFALNLIGYQSGEHAVLTASVLRTALSVFDHGRTYVVPSEEPGASDESLDNILMFFSNSPFNESDPSGLTPKDRIKWERLSNGAISIDPAPGQIVTDDLNPMDRWTPHINEVWRARLFKSLGSDVLSY